MFFLIFIGFFMYEYVCGGFFGSFFLQVVLIVTFKMAFITLVQPFELENQVLLCLVIQATLTQP